MPCYNSEAHVMRGVASVLGQTYPNVELIAVNDGSTDHTLRLLTRITDARVKVISQPNRGVSAARNRGITESSGAFIAFLDTDDTWRTDCLRKLYDAMQNAPETVLAYCGWQNIGLTGGRGKPYVPPDYETEGKLHHFLQGCPWPIHAALIRRSAIVDQGGFDERLSHAEDYALWLRVAAFGRIVLVPEVMAFYNFHGGSQATSNRGKVAGGQLQVQLEFLKKHPEVVRTMGKENVRRLIYGGLLEEGFTCYWNRDLEAARKIFRMAVKAGYGTMREWKYLLPAFLPFPAHKWLIRLLSREDGRDKK